MTGPLSRNGPVFAGAHGTLDAIDFARKGQKLAKMPEPAGASTVVAADGSGGIAATAGMLEKPGFLRSHVLNIFHGNQTSSLFFDPLDTVQGVSIGASDARRTFVSVITDLDHHRFELIHGKEARKVGTAGLVPQRVLVEDRQGRYGSPSSNGTSIAALRYACCTIIGLDRLVDAALPDYFGFHVMRAGGSLDDAVVFTDDRIVQDSRGDRVFAGKSLVFTHPQGGTSELLDLKGTCRSKDACVIAASVLFTGTRDDASYGFIIFLDKNLKPLARYGRQDLVVTDLLILPDGAFVASGSLGPAGKEDGRMFIWDRMPGL